MKLKKTGLLLVSGVFLAGCAAMATQGDGNDLAMKMLKEDFRSKGPATMERMLNQDEAQKLCSEYPTERPKEVAARIEATQMKNIKLPSDGKYLGKWQEGEKVAQNGRGMQSSDQVGGVNGGNCYACHQISKQEISYGNIGPSLYNYGKLRGQSDAIMQYTWGKIYNSQAYTACSNMPRFGHAGILTEGQLKDVMALLMDPASPVNK
ncbi:sulfur oxidation c-type cytochrome SoxX [Lacisediminimonas profundi]|uniref:sulfur oxidation c-type cytochrome SoxX n=1 Tax=Lacisediminimonas profundi TaxID=2603856 RepID=UPI00124B99AA